MNAMARVPGRTTALRSRGRAWSRSVTTTAFKAPSRSPRLMARIWWPWRRGMDWAKS